MKLLHVFENALTENYKNGEVIVNAFDEPEGVYLIKSGYVKSYTVDGDGNLRVQLVRSKGDIFPLLWGVGQITRDVYFGALGDVEVKKLSLKDFQAEIAKPELQKDLQKRLLEVYLLLAERVRYLEQKTVNERLLCCLNNLAERFGKDSDGHVLMDLPIHHHDLADMINASREATSREFSKLEKAGIVGYKDGHMYINTYA